MRWIGLGLLLSIIAGGAYRGGTARPESRTALAGQPPAARPASPPLPRRIFAAGAVEGTQRDVPLRFEIAGRIRTVRVKDGDAVEAGDVLVELDPGTWQAKLAEAKARLTLARAERDRLVNGASHEGREVLKSEVAAAEVVVREAEGHLARSHKLARGSAISTQELEDQRYRFEKAAAQLHLVRARLEDLEAPVRQDDLRVAEAKVALAEAVVAQDRTQLEKTRLTAPARGRILRIDAEAGDLVGPSGDHDLVTIANRDHTRIRAYVEELDALHVAVGQTAYVTVDGNPGTQYAGIVRSCAPTVRPKSQRHHQPGELVDLRVREVLIELDDGDELVSGLPVDVFIQPEL